MVAGVGFPAGPAAVDGLLGGGQAGANRATRPDHPIPIHAADDSRTGTSRRLAIRRRTNNNVGLSS